MFSDFLVDTFRAASMKECHDRIKTYVDPETEWSPFLMMDSNDHDKFMATELGPEHFKNADTLEQMFSEYITETLSNLKADMAAFIKPVWIGRVPESGEPDDVNHFHQGILIIVAYPMGLESWVAPITRSPNTEPGLGKFTSYRMDADNTGSWVRKAFQRILDGSNEVPKLLTEGGEDKVEDVPLD